MSEGAAAAALAPPPPAAPAPLLRRLFEPLVLNGLELPNRVLMSSMHMNMDELPDQYERMAAFYALRAREQVGLIVSAGCAPDAAGRAMPGGFALDDDALVERHRAITRAVHAEGGRIALQILHFGREAFHGGLVSSSAERLPSNMFTPRALTEDELQATIAAFADCAARAVQAGYDAIELIFSQGFLVHQFLAPACNRRSDRWGGPFENRIRLALEVARAVRTRVGPRFPLIFRIPCMDLLDGGLTPDESLALIEALLPFGIDLLNVSIGWHESGTPTIAMVVPRAAFASASRLVRQRFPGLRTAVSNRINDPRTAERLLLDGDADVVAMARPFLADPALVRKARANDFDAINTCIACNQSCLDYVFTSRPVGCSVNPDCALPGEGRWPPLRRPLTVAVAGGGISGMGAALFLARRGARVVLFEATPWLGGQLRLAARIPDKGEFEETIRYHAHALREAGVEIRLGQAFDEAAVRAAPWDHVVLAQGSAPHRPEGVPGLDQPQVLDYADVLERGVPVAFPVVVIGGGGVACDLAKYLCRADEAERAQRERYLATRAAGAEIGRYLALSAPAEAQPGRTAARITLLQRSSRKFAHRVGRTTRWILMDALAAGGVVMRNRIDVLEVGPDGVLVHDRRLDRTELLPARSVIVAAGQVPRAAPLQALERAGIAYSVLGAARSGGSGTNLTSALAGAYQLAMEFA